MRDVVNGLYLESNRFNCNSCYFDKLTSKSTGKCKWTVTEADQLQTDYALTNPGVTRYKYFSVGRCPVCRGKGLLETPRMKIIDCLVIWNPKGASGDNEDVYTAAGTFRIPYN